MKLLFAILAALSTSVAFAQLPEYADQATVADLDPTRTDLYIGAQFLWDAGATTGSMLAHHLSRQTTLSDGTLISCEVTEISRPEPRRVGVGPESLAVERIDSSDAGAAVVITATPYVGKTILEFSCLKTLASGQGSPFTPGDFKLLFPSGSRRTGFYRLPRPRS